MINPWKFSYIPWRIATRTPILSADFRMCLLKEDWMWSANNDVSCLKNELIFQTTLISEVRTTISDGTSKSHIVRVEPQEEAYRFILHLSYQFWAQNNNISDYGTRVKCLQSSMVPVTTCAVFSVCVSRYISKNPYRCFNHLFQFVPHLREVFLLQCRHLLTKTEMIEQLRREEYDAVIGETFDYCGFGHIF